MHLSLSIPPCYLLTHSHTLTQVLTNSDKTQTDDGARHNLTIETVSFVRILCAARAPLETALRVGVRLTPILSAATLTILVLPKTKDSKYAVSCFCFCVGQI